MRRSWSIRARTAVAFAVASVVLVTGVLVFVNLASQWSLSATVVAASAVEDAAEHTVGGAVAPAPDGTGGSVVSVVAQQQWQWSAVAVAVAGVLAGVVGWFVSRRMLRPVDRIAAAAERLSASTLHERIGLDGPDDELRRLSRTIDALLDRLEAAFASQRRFVAQASHELRTPLAVQRAVVQVDLHDDVGPAEVALVRAELLDQNRRTERLVESLLVLAEAERGLDGRVGPVDLAEVVDDVVAHHADTARAAGVSVCLDLPEQTASTIVAEPVLLRQLVTNLVDNAVEYNVAGGTVWIRVSGPAVSVENTGSEVPAASVPLLLEPFRRGAGQGDERHSGLGLSIVSAIVDAHRGVFHVTPRHGGGLRCRVEFPTR